MTTFQRIAKMPTSVQQPPTLAVDFAAGRPSENYRILRPPAQRDQRKEASQQDLDQHLDDPNRVAPSGRAATVSSAS